MKHFYLIFLFALLSSCVTTNQSYQNYTTDFYSEESNIERDEEIEKYKLNPKETLVDIGTGDTFFACEIARKYPEMKFILEDKWEIHIFEGKAKDIQYIIDNNAKCSALRNRSSFVKGKQSKVPIASNSQSQILLRRTFHELKKPGLIINELRRILKKDGIVIIADIEPKFKGEKDKGCKNLYVPESEVIKQFKGFKHLSSDSVMHDDRKKYILRFQK